MLNKVFWVFIEKAGVTILQFVSLIILSRLLSPDDYGIYGIMMVFIAVSDMLVDSGFGGAIVYKNAINQRDINTFYMFNIAISIVLYIILFAISPFFESYYNIEGLSDYLRVLGVSIILFALSQVQNALLIKKLEFRKSALINVLSTILSSLIAIYMAYFGYGVWSLIAQVIFNSMFVTASLWLTSKVKVGLDVSKQSFMYFWNFGSNLLFANILQTVVNNISTSIIPKIGNITQSGYFFQATRINNIPTNIITLSIDKFSFPVLSKEKDLACLETKARCINRAVLLFFLPLFPLLSYCSHPLIDLLLGEKWLDVSCYFSILCWSGLGLLIQVLYRNIIKSIGNTRGIMYIEIIKSCLTFVSILIGACYGIDYLIISIVLMAYAGAFIWSYYLKKQMNFSWIRQFKDIAKPALSFTIVYALLLLLPIPFDSYYRFCILPIGYIAYLIVNILVKQEEILSIFYKIMNR